MFVYCKGVLIAKKSLFRNHAPSEGGGGSVFFVSRDGHRYLQDEEMREEGGTPRVAGIVRAALAMELKLVSLETRIVFKCYHYYGPNL